MNLRQVATALLSLGLLTGCAAGHDAVTIKPYTPADGNQSQSGTIKVRNALVVLQADGSADLIATILDSAEESDAVTAITVNSQPVALTLPNTGLAQNRPVIFGGESANATGKIAALGLKAGQLAQMNITFAKAAPITMTIVVRDASGEFAPASPTATPAA